MYNLEIMTVGAHLCVRPRMGRHIGLPLPGGNNNITNNPLHDQIERLLDEADEAIRDLDWTKVGEKAKEVLALDPTNEDTTTYLAASGRARDMGRTGAAPVPKPSTVELPPEYHSLKWLVEISTVGVLVVEASTRKILLANGEMQRIMGLVHRPEHDWGWYEKAYVRRRPDGTVYATKDLPLERALEHGETVRGEELWLEFADGRKVRVVASATPAYSESGQLIAAFVISQDITPLDATIPLHEPAAVDAKPSQTVILPVPAYGSEVTLEFAFGTEQGPERKNNEDSLYCEPGGSERARDKGWLFAVADGMGGAAMGEVASQMAVRALSDNYYSNYYPGSERLRRAALNANSTVYEAGQKNPAYKGMGTTLTAAVIIADRVVIAHIGDSRAYLFRGGAIRKLTDDHAMAAELVKARAITQELVAVNPFRNVLTRAVGSKENVEVDLIHQELFGGDVVMLCSDGIFKRLTEQQLAGALGSHDPQGAADSLIELSKQSGGDDDMTIIVVSYTRMYPDGPRRGL